MKGYRVEEVFDNITHKLEHSIPLAKEDLVPLTFCPLMDGDLPQMRRIQKALHIVHESEHLVSDTDKIEAVIYAMASKFLNPTELNQIKEEIKMTELGTLIYNDGITDGIEREALDNAKNLLLNGASFELVRKSILNISDEDLCKIYDEVMATKTPND